MARCDAEMCPHWTGFGCICEVLGDALGIERVDQAVLWSCACGHDETEDMDNCTDCGAERPDEMDDDWTEEGEAS